MKMRGVVLLLLTLAGFLGLPAISGAQGAADQFAFVQVIRSCPSFCNGYNVSTTSALVVVTSDFSFGWLVTDNPNDVGPAWSPDRTRIAFTRTGEIMVVDFPGGLPANVTNHAAFDGAPAWSPDGSRIAFASDRDGQAELYLMNPDGSDAVRLTDSIGFAGRPAWSPDGARIAFTCVIESGNSDICAVNADGTGFVRLTADPAEDSGPAWSPDGTRIAFATARYTTQPTGIYGVDLQLAVMNPDGTGVSQVGTGTPGFHPSWSPNGARLAFVRTDPCDFMVCDNVYVINADGTDEVWVWEGGSPAWRPALDPPAPEVALGLASLSFGSQAVATTSIPQTVSVINIGNADLAVSELTVSGDFAQTNTCGSGVAAGATCTITVTFTPTATGPRSGAVTITDNAAGSPREIPLSGSGALPAPSVEIYPKSVIFGSQVLGSTSSAHIVSLTNTGSANLVISGIAVSGDFAQTNTCGSSVAAGGSCTISVTFTPTLTGQRTGTVTIVHNAAGSSHGVALSGIGNILPVASFTFACTGLTCSFDASGSSDPGGTFLAYAWNFGDGTAGSGVAVSHTYTAAGTYPVTLTVTDGDGATGMQSQNVGPLSQPTIHVGDLDRASTSQGGSWTAAVTVTVHDGSHTPVANAMVTGHWINWGSAWCTTNESGWCTVSRSGIPKKTGNVTFTVGTVTHATMTYKAAANHDPDPDSDSTGTSITVSRP